MENKQKFIYKTLQNHPEILDDFNARLQDVNLDIYANVNTDDFGGHQSDKVEQEYDILMEILEERGIGYEGATTETNPEVQI